MFENKNRMRKTLVTFRLLSPIDLGCTLSRQAEVLTYVIIFLLEEILRKYHRKIHLRVSKVVVDHNDLLIH